MDFAPLSSFEHKADGNTNPHRTLNTPTTARRESEAGYGVNCSPVQTTKSARSLDFHLRWNTVCLHQGSHEHGAGFFALQRLRRVIWPAPRLAYGRWRLHAVAHGLAKR